MKYYTYIITVLLLLFFTSCKKDVLPKPNAHLRLDYDPAQYERYQNNCAYTFDVNKAGVVKNLDSCNFSITYPNMKASIFLSYKKINNDLNTLLRDAQKLTFEHVIKADDIIEQPFINNDDRVFGMFYEVNGNAATQVQFYVTDSINHFVNCSVYFYVKPNFDSILPAAAYVRNDIQHLMESFRWNK